MEEYTQFHKELIHKSIQAYARGWEESGAEPPSREDLRRAGIRFAIEEEALKRHEFYRVMFTIDEAAQHITNRRSGKHG